MWCQHRRYIFRFPLMVQYNFTLTWLPIVQSNSSTNLIVLIVPPNNPRTTSNWLSKHHLYLNLHWGYRRVQNKHHKFMRASYMKHFAKFLAILHHNASFFNFCFIINLLHIFEKLKYYCRLCLRSPCCRMVRLAGGYLLASLSSRLGMPPLIGWDCKLASYWSR